MEIDALPEAVRDLIETWRDGGMAPQPPITWPRDRWLKDLPELCLLFGRWAPTSLNGWRPSAGNAGQLNERAG